MRTMLNPDDIHPKIKDEVANFQSEIVQEVTQTVADNRVVVVGWGKILRLFTAKNINMINI